MFTIALPLLFLAFLLSPFPTFGTDERGEESTPEDLNKILGKFQRYSVDKYDEYLDALGVNLVKRKALVAADPVLEIRKSGNTWTNIVSTPFKNWEYTYVLWCQRCENNPLPPGSCILVKISLDYLLSQQQEIDML
jgi:hypothetical protein